MTRTFIAKVMQWRRANQSFRFGIRGLSVRKLYRVAVLQAEGSNRLNSDTEWRQFPVQRLEICESTSPAYPSGGSSIDSKMWVKHRRNCADRSNSSAGGSTCCVATLHTSHIKPTGQGSNRGLRGERQATCCSLKKGGHLSSMKTQSVPRSKHYLYLCYKNQSVNVV